MFQASLLALTEDGLEAKVVCGKHFTKTLDVTSPSLSEEQIRMYQELKPIAMKVNVITFDILFITQNYFLHLFFPIMLKCGDLNKVLVHHISMVCFYQNSLGDTLYYLYMYSFHKSLVTKSNYLLEI